ncbi:MULTISPECIES: GlxA family transcriptional regulator [Commensalibacter]|uniref:GlxA family transcriptional regulator n=1 Tax=Commensalibacter TaxID=1079922 RepID=UPI0018DB68D6|nr:MULTISPECIES: helix-turn-helix domain-containing protein [Commensalibacter]MBH9973892.1 helix-turn-helix domain-containing protein [Commensalibacter melissae]MBI0017445.1 helix-turn-helix domain-containing protein [Commensalibacter sp. B14384M2]MBI0019192.1 helix-turn-helix domain-containing protein [Commensalibacter sp. W8133]MBI0050489.1 helix-turn-helix domain-containing protein [Commensalibacter sp. B14384M3]MBI0180142.1 helix-turn-helix domain-containing protein [Commensalibacter sp. W
MKKIDLINIGLLMYPNVQQGAIFGLIDFFSVANQLVKEKWNTNLPIPQIKIVKIDKPTVNFDLPSFIVKKNDLNFSVIIVPPCTDEFPSGSKYNMHINFLKHSLKQPCTIASIGNGIFLLAETGLLDGYTVTTHWQLKHRFKNQFPNIYTDFDSMVIEERNIITTAGSLSWIDLGLELVKKFFGSIVMAEVARFFLVQPARRAQSYFNIFSPNLTHGDIPIIKGQKWISNQKNMNITLKQLSKVTGLEIRTLQRRFIKATGMTVTEYIQHHRICRAQFLLQFSKKLIDEIGIECGYKDLNAFRKIFTKIVGLSPSLYRRNFTV